MTARYGSKWLSQWSTPEQVTVAKKIWSIDVGVTSRKAVEKAFWKMKDTHPQWPPTSAEFGLLCAGQFADALGIPEIDEVFKRLIEQPWRPDLSVHPIYWGIIAEANKGVSLSVMRSWRESRSKPQLRKIYEKCKREMLFGVKFEPPIHVVSSCDTKRLSQTISSEESNQFLDENAKQIGRDFLNKLKKQIVTGVC